MTEGYYEAHCFRAAAERRKAIFVVEEFWPDNSYRMLAYTYDLDDAKSLVRYYNARTPNPVRWRRFDP